MHKLLIVFLLPLFGCTEQGTADIKSLLLNSPSIEGKTEYLPSPYVTAGDRLYMVGHQDGSFPEIGWHIQGEMGGIWDHPIKLMDGFDVIVTVDGEEIPLNQASKFVNYPMANMHLFQLPDLGLEIERWQFVPDGEEGIFVQFLINNLRDEPSEVSMKFTGHVDLMPTWLGERTNMVDGKDRIRHDVNSRSWIAKDSLNPWFVVFGTDETTATLEESDSEYQGNGVSASIDNPMSLPANGQSTWNVTIAGSYHSEELALNTFKRLQSNPTSLLAAKRDRYHQLAAKSKLTIPDKDLQETFEWLKYNCDWLIRTVPEVGSGMTAGIPDYPWWFGVDSEYALKGYMAIGREDVVNNTIRLLDSVSEALIGNGMIIHEMSSNGAVFNPGNINETPQFASLIKEIYDWNGDQEFLQRYFPTIKKGLLWLMQEKDANGNLFPDGFGMMEIHGLNSEMIDVAAYTQRAFADAAYLAGELELDTLQIIYRVVAERLRNKVNDEFWSEEFGSYADFIGTDEQALHLIEDAIIRADTLNKPWAVDELRQTKAAILANPSEEPRPFVLHHNWVVNTPMEMRIADPEKAMIALETAKQFVNPYGVFVTGIDRDESAGSDDGSFQGSKAFSYTGAVMTLPTGVQAISENNYGRPDEALNYLKRMTRSFSYAFPGSMYEVSPDYGMIVQAWNIYSFAIPIVNQFFGIQPDAVRKTVRIELMMPESWDEASLEDVQIADNEVSIFYQKNQGQVTLQIEQQRPDWTIEVVLNEMQGKVAQITEGSMTEHQEGEQLRLIGQGKSFLVQVK